MNYVVKGYSLDILSTRFVIRSKNAELHFFVIIKLDTLKLACQYSFKFLY